MATLDIVNQFVENSNIAKAFGLDVNSFLTLILGSFIVGYFGLTFYYKIYYSHETWKDLEFSEKAIVSVVVGFLTILLSQYTLVIIQLMIINDPNYKKYEQLFSQYTYILPLLYFIAISVILAKKNYTELNFIKYYIWWCFIPIVGLCFILVSILLYLNKAYYGILELIILILFIFELYTKKPSEILLGIMKRLKAWIQKFYNNCKTINKK